MMTNVLQTDARELADRLSLPLLLNLLLADGLPLRWPWKRPLQPLPLRRQALRNGL